MKSQHLNVVNQIFFNPYLLANIFQHLTCQEQLKFAKICNNFQYIIINHVWKSKYKNLHILEFMSKYVLLNVVPNEILNENDFREFLQLNDENIKELKVNTFSMLNKCSIMFDMDLRFSNLIQLSVRDVKFTVENINNLPRIFPNLKKVCIKHCYRANGAAIHTIKDFDIDIFQKLSGLEELKIDNIFQNVYVRNQI